MLRFSALYAVLLLTALTLSNLMVFADTRIDTNHEKPVILVWGDSLSAAYGIPVEQGWVHLLRKKLQDSHTVINGSISGETTNGGLTRLPDALDIHQPNILVLELGANDGLRGQPTSHMENNLKQMIELAKQAGADTVLLGIKIPPNYGMVYTDKFDQVYSDLAQQYALPFLPFFLDKVALESELMQADRLHPNAAAQPKILETVWTVLEPALSADKNADTDTAVSND